MLDQSPSAAHRGREHIALASRDMRLRTVRHERECGADQQKCADEPDGHRIAGYLNVSAVSNEQSVKAF
jgi:hypothetical protein